MNFTTFLKLYENSNVGLEKDKVASIGKSELLAQSILKCIKDSHYEKDSNSISFNIGSMLNIPTYSNLRIFIRENGGLSNLTRLGKDKDGSYVIVVDVDILPKIVELKEFLNQPDILRGIITSLSKYLNIGDVSHVVEDNSVSEEVNDPEVFEEYYQALISKIRGMVGEYKNTIEDFENKISDAATSSQKITYELALDKFKKDFIFGETEKEFIKFALDELNRIDKDFLDNLTPDNKKRLEHRLSQFYKSAPY